MLKFLSSLLILSLFAACSSNQETKVVDDKINGRSYVHPVTDAEISNTILTADTEEINLSELGRTKASSKSVKAFADKMYHEHSIHSTEATAMIEKNKLMPPETKTSMEMTGSSEAELANLKLLSGPEFDKAFMAAQIKAHEDVLKDIKEVLIPNAQNENLVSFLEKTQHTVEDHLDHARSVQATL